MSERNRKYKILNLGAGVQSSAIYCLMADGEIEPADFAVFSDTQDEPAWVYDQVKWLESLGAGVPIVRVSAGCIGDDLKRGIYTKNKGTRFAAIPAFTTYREGEKGGITRRQCTREYKIEPIEKWIRRELLELQPRQRIPRDVLVCQLFGFSTDEPQRAVKMRIQYDKRGDAWACDFPLFDDQLMMTRRDCERYMMQRAGFQWRSSRCVFCPLQSNHHWREIKQHDAEGFARAVEVDASLREEGTIYNRDLNEIMYVHRSHRPLSEANLDEGQQTLFDDDGGCDQGCFL